VEFRWKSGMHFDVLLYSCRREPVSNFNRDSTCEVYQEALKVELPYKRKRWKAAMEFKFPTELSPG